MGDTYYFDRVAFLFSVLSLRLVEVVECFVNKKEEMLFCQIKYKIVRSRMMKQ